MPLLNDSPAIQDLGDISEILHDSVNKPLIGEIVGTQLLQDKVVSTIRMFRTGVVNENNRAYSKKSGKTVVEALQAEIDSGLLSEVANDHSQGLYNKKGVVGKMFYERECQEKTPANLAARKIFLPCSPGTSMKKRPALSKGC